MTIRQGKLTRIYELADRGLNVEQIVKITHASKNTIKKYLKKRTMHKKPVIKIKKTKKSLIIALHIRWGKEK